MSDNSKSVAAAVAPSAPAPVAPLQPVITVETLAAALTQAMGAVAATQASGNAGIAEAIKGAVVAAQPKPKITIANRRRFNPNNPTNRERKLRVKFFQNFAEIDVEEMSDEVFDLLNSGKLKQGGFLNDPRTGPMFEIINVKRGAQIGLHLRYDNSTINKRMLVDSKVQGGLAGILRLCIREAEEQAVARKARRDAGLEDDDE